jgi:membrane protein
VNAQPPRRDRHFRRALSRLRAELHLIGLAIWRGFKSFYNSDDLTYASSIAYYALLSLFPFFLLAFSIIASVTNSDADRAAVMHFVLRYFPTKFDFVTYQLEELQRAQVRRSIFGSLLLIWAAMGVFGAITSAINHAWGVEKLPSYFRHKLISFVMLVFAGLLLLLALFVVSAVSIAEV